MTAGFFNAVIRRNYADSIDYQHVEDDGVTPAPLTGVSLTSRGSSSRASVSTLLFTLTTSVLSVSSGTARLSWTAVQSGTLTAGEPGPGASGPWFLVEAYDGTTTWIVAEGPVEVIG